MVMYEVVDTVKFSKCLIKRHVSVFFNRSSSG